MRTTAIILVIGIALGAGGIVVFTDLGPVSADIQITDSSNGDQSLSQTGEDDTSGSGETATATNDQQASDTAAGNSTPVDEDTSESQEGPSNGEITGAVSQAIQQKRQSLGVSPLKRTEPMDGLAHHHSQEMANNNFFLNEAPWGDTLKHRKIQEDMTCSQVFDSDNEEYLRGAQIIYRESGENLPSADEIADDAIDNWRSSERDNRYLLLEEWTEIGVSTQQSAQDGETTAYVTVVFC